MYSLKLRPQHKLALKQLVRYRINEMAHPIASVVDSKTGACLEYHYLIKKPSQIGCTGYYKGKPCPRAMTIF